MHKKTMLILLYGLLVIPSCWANSLTQSVNITGRIVASPCIVDTNTVKQTVDLGKTFTHNLTLGTGSDWKEFQLTLSKCPSDWTQATVTFTGAAASDDNYYVNAGTATGLVLQISDSAHTVSYGNGDVLSETIDASHNAVFPLEARMYNLDNSVTGGSFSAVIQVNFTYQ